MGKSRLDISVVIPTYKRPLLLKRCLVSLQKQTLHKNFYEILVVDDGKDNETKELVAKFAKQFGNIRYIPVQKKQSGPAIARNIGWKNAQGEIIAFTDDDTIPDKGWLKEGYQAFKKDIDAVSGKVVVPISQSPTDYEKNIFHLSEVDFVTANCFYRKKILEEVGGFDERFSTAWREDSDLEFKLLEQHKKVIKASKAIVVHPVRKAPWGVSIHEQKKSMFNALLYKKHPLLYRKTIQRSPPWRYYVICMSFVIALISLAFHNYFISEVTGGIWLFLTFSFFMQRITDTSHSFSHISEMLVTSFVIPFLSIYYRLYGAVKFNVFFL